MPTYKTQKKRIKIYRTEGEFEEMNLKIKSSGKTDLNYYLRSEIYKLERNFEKSPTTLTAASGEKVYKVHYIEEKSYQILLKLSIIMKKPISSIVDELIISPLLTPKL